MTTMRFINPIPFVRDIGRSRELYEKRHGLKVLEDAGSFVLFETGLQSTMGRRSPRNREIIIHAMSSCAGHAKLPCVAKVLTFAARLHES